MEGTAENVDECVLQRGAIAVLDVRGLAEHLFGISPIAGQTNRQLCAKINEKFASGESITLPVESIVPGAVPEFNAKTGFTTIRIQYKFLKQAVKVRAIDYVTIEHAEDKADENGRVKVYWSGFQSPTTEPYDAVKMALERQSATATATATTAIAQEAAPPKRRKLSSVVAERRYVAVPAVVGEISLPDDDALLRAGKTMLRKRAPLAPSKMSKWWQTKAASDLQRLVNIDDNLECGDCMYHALAPMVRAIMPQRFADVPNESEPTMLRLRQLLAAQLARDAENELRRYIAQYAQDYDTEKERNAFDKQFSTIVDRDQLLAALQDDLMQATHWAHLVDFELLNRLLAPAGVATVVLNGRFNEKQPRNPAMQNVSVQQLREHGTRFLLVLHSRNHFTRLQSAESGQFVFTQRQLQQAYPILWRTLTQIVEPSSDALQVNALVQDVAKDFPDPLPPALKPLLTASDGTMHYDRVVHGLFNVSASDVYTELLQRDERVGRYRSLSEAEKANVRQNLIDKKMQNVEALQARIDRHGAAQKVTAAAATQKTTAAAGAEASTAQFCNEPSSSEKEQVAEAFENAQANAAAVDKANAQLKLPQPQRAGSTGPIDVEEFTDVVVKDYQIFTTVGDISLRSDSVLRLRDNAWLNDDVINSYITVLLARGAKAGVDVDAVSTYFYAALSKAATERDLEQAEFKFIGKEFHPFRLQKLFIPIHSGNHWALVMVDFGKKRIAYFDSYCAPNVADAAAILHNVRRYLHFKAEKDPRSGFRDWIEVRPNVPQQKNATDCGVFLLAFLEEAIQKSFDDRFRVTQADISCFRKRILLALLANNGLPKVDRRRLPPALPPLPAQSASATATAASATTTSAKQARPPKLSFHDSDEWSVEAVDSADAAQSQGQVKGVKVIGF